MTSDIVSNLRRSFVGKNDRKMKSGVKTIAWVDSDRRKVESPIKFPSPISTAVWVLASNKISVDQGTILELFYTTLEEREFVKLIRLMRCSFGVVATFVLIYPGDEGYISWIIALVVEIYRIIVSAWPAEGWFCLTYAARLAFNPLSMTWNFW